MKHTLFIFLLAFFLTPMAYPQAKQKSGARDPFDDKLSKAVSNAPKANFDFEKLSGKQKRHMEIYWQIKQLKLNNNYSKEKCYEPLYFPVAEFFAQLEPLAAKEALSWKEKSDAFLQAGKTEQSSVASRRQNIYMSMAKICHDFTKEYKAKKDKKLRNLMTQYKTQEVLMQVEGLKYPKRDWLAPGEAELMIREWERRRNANK